MLLTEPGVVCLPCFQYSVIMMRLTCGCGQVLLQYTEPCRDLTTKLATICQLRCFASWDKTLLATPRLGSLSSYRTVSQMNRSTVNS